MTTLQTRTLAAPRELPHLTTSDTLTVNGREITRGVEVTVAGIRGRCAFVRHVRNANGAEWVDLTTSRGRSRTVRPDAIRTVHRRQTGVGR